MSLGTAAENQSESLTAEGRITDSVPSFLPAGDNRGRAEEEVSDGNRQGLVMPCVCQRVCALGQGAAGCVDGGVRQESTCFSGQFRSSTWNEADRTVKVKVPRK